MYKHRKGN